MFGVPVLAAVDEAVAAAPLGLCRPRRILHTDDATGGVGRAKAAPEAGTALPRMSPILRQVRANGNGFRHKLG